MKKTFLAITALAAMLFAGCTSSDELTTLESIKTADNTPTPVKFGTYMGKVGTRSLAQSYSKGTIGNADATKRGITDLKKAQFGVFAYSTGSKDYRGETTTPDPFDWTTANANGTWKYDERNAGTPRSGAPNFMYNEKIYWSGDAVDSEGAQWVYDVVKYWPNGIDAANATYNSSNPSTTSIQNQYGKLSFFAYSPYMQEASATDVTGGPTGVVAKKVNTPMKYDNGTPADDSDDKENGIIGISTNESPTNVWVKYVMPSANVTDAVDLLWGLSGKNSYIESDGSNPSLTIGSNYNENLTKEIVKTGSNVERVKFLFKHALTKIGGATTSDESESITGDPAQCGFKVVVDIDGNHATGTAGQDNQTTYFPDDAFSNNKTLVTLKEVKIRDSKSVYTDNDVPGFTDTPSNLINSGWFNIEEGKWENGAVEGGAGATYKVIANNTDTDTDNAIYTLNEAIKEIGAKKNGEAGDGKELESGNASWNATVNPKGVTTTATPLFANENVPGLMLIPGGSGNDIFITVDYIVRTADPKLAAGYSEVEQVITNKVSLASVQPNKYYTIIIHLGLTSVKFEAKVADWQTHVGGSYDTDGNYSDGGSAANEQSIWLPSNVVGS